jgi:hypothetical protein
VSVPKVVNAPERIYLTTGDLFFDPIEFSELADVSWCADRQFDEDVPYVREDLHHAEVERLTAEVEQLRLWRRGRLTVEDEGNALNIGFRWVLTREELDLVPRDALLGHITDRFRDSLAKLLAEKGALGVGE